MQAAHLILIALLALASSNVFAYGPNHLHDFRVAINDTKKWWYDLQFSLPIWCFCLKGQTLIRVYFGLFAVFVNGKFYKDPKLVKAEDFFYTLKGTSINNPLDSKVTPTSVNEIFGLNTLGVSLARIDVAPYGLNPPHAHSRGIEILVVVEGTLLVGSVPSNADGSCLFTKVLNQGDVFVFPNGLIHFQLNMGKKNAIAIVGLSI